MGQRGFVPIIILICVLIAVVIGTTLYIKQRRIDQNAKLNLTSQKENTTASPSASTTNNSPTIKLTPSPTQSALHPTTAPSTPTPQPVNTPAPTPINTPTPTPQSSCGINALATPLDPSSSFDNPLTILLTYSATPTGNKYMTGAQWDFDGNGNWDTDMTQSNGSIAHTFPSNGNYNVKLQLKMSDGEITPVCNKTVTVPMGLTVRLTGQVFSDTNCNGMQEPNEQGIPGVTINIFRMPEFSLYTTVTSDNNGYYNLTRIIDPQGSLSIQPGDVAAPGYKISAGGHTVTLNSTQSSFNQNLPQVPYEKMGLCSY